MIWWSQNFYYKVHRTSSWSKFTKIPCKYHSSMQLKNYKLWHIFITYNLYIDLVATSVVMTVKNSWIRKMYNLFIKRNSIFSFMYYVIDVQRWFTFNNSWITLYYNTVEQKIRDVITTFMENILPYLQITMQNTTDIFQTSFDTLKFVATSN